MDSGSRTGAIPLMATKATNEAPNVRLEATPLDILWMEKYRRLEDFRKAFGHCRVPPSFEDKPLWSWVANQRSFQKAGTLRKDREQLLNDLGFTWSPATSRKEAEHILWMAKYNQVVAFKELHGHCHIPIKENAELCRWLNNQRKAYRAGTLQKERQVLLDQIGFVWNVKKGPPKAALLASMPTFDFNGVEKNEEVWNKMFARLLEYSMQHGHADIPVESEDQELAQWVAFQRKVRTLGQLEAKREKDLSEIGLTWEPQGDEPVNGGGQFMSKKDGELWMSQFRLLGDFVKLHGHANVPRAGETNALAQWLVVQQRLMERDRLPEDKKKLLADLLSAQVSVPVSIDVPAMSLAEATAKASSGLPPNDKPAMLQDKANTPLRDTSSGSMTSSILSKPTSKVMDQKFPIGTRIQKVFDVDGESQTFGGNVTAFELYEEEDGTKTWGYLIEYDDGDKEHLLEGDVAKHRVVVKSVKRAAKSHGKASSNKLVKQMKVSGNDNRSSMSDEKTTELVADQAQAITTQHSETPESAVQARKTGTGTISSTKGHEMSRPRAEAKKLPRDDGKIRAPRLRDAKLSQPSGEITQLPKVIKNPATSNVLTKKKKTLFKRPAVNDSASDSSSSEDEPLHLLARKPIQTKEAVIQTSINNKSEENEKEIQHDVIDLLDDDDEMDELLPAGDTTPTRTLHNQSHETSPPNQKFPRGTLISRKFFDLSDNEREKLYGGKVANYVYLNEEKDWFYFIKYDDGDTEFMDEWEVAKFSSSMRS